jgi:hypothetical protein
LPSCSVTSTASNTSMTPRAMQPGMRNLSSPPLGSVRCCARGTPWREWAATNSYS